MFLLRQEIAAPNVSQILLSNAPKLGFSHGPRYREPSAAPALSRDKRHPQNSTQVTSNRGVATWQTQRNAQLQRIKKARLKRVWLRLKDPGMTYFRACEHYHWPCKLNVRVRNGYACFLASNPPGNHREDSGAALPCVYV